MAAVETVSGPIDVGQLGLTLIHEHFRAADEGVRFQFPHLYDEQEEWDRAIADARAVRSHGVATVVEPSALFLTRDAAFETHRERSPTVFAKKGERPLMAYSTP